MSNVVPHLAMRFTRNADSPTTDIVATYDLAMDSPRNFQQTGGKLNMVDYIAQPIPEALLTDTVRTDSPKGKTLKGQGILLKIDLTLSWKTGNAPSAGSTDENEVGTTEYDGWAIASYLATGMSGVTDGVSVYCWLSTNYQWNTTGAAETWFRVVPDLKTFRPGYGSAARQTWGFSCSFLSFKNYVSIVPANWRRGFTYAGAGVLTATNGSAAVVGSGGSKFKNEFMHGDRVYKADGTTLIGVVDTVADDTHLTLRAVYGGTTYTTSAYVTNQRSNSEWSVPIYAFTEFTATPAIVRMVIMTGLFAARPAAAAVGNQFYYSTDTNHLYFSNGTSWVTVV